MTKVKGWVVKNETLLKENYISINSNLKGMNRKLVNGLLLLSVATAGCGVFTSCKDTDEDFKNEVIKGQVDIQKQIEDLLATYKPCECNLDARLAALKAELEQAIKDGDKENADALKTAVADLQSKIDGINSLIDTFQDQLDKKADQATLDTWGNAIKSAMEALEDKTEELENKLKNYYTKDELADKLAQITLNAEAIKDLEDDFSELNELINGENGLVKQIQANASNIADLKTIVDENTEAITKLENTVNKYFSSLKERLNKLITSIDLSQTWNPMFGTINLPVGLSTTILANYYGMSDHAFEFPFPAGYEYNGNNSVLNEKDIHDAIGHLQATMKGDPVRKQSNEKYIAEDAEMKNNLGQLYLNINPVNVDFSGTKLSLVNSKGEVAPIALTTDKNDELLTFGTNLTRAENSLYRANAHVEGDDAAKIALQIEPGLKSAMKDALLDHTKQDFVQLAKLLYQQFDGMLPAYGVKAGWTAKDENGNDVEYAYVSKYEVAAATFRPLSYEFMYDQSIDHKLPIFDPVTDLIRDLFNEIDMDFNLKFDEIDGLDFELDIKDPEITMENQTIIIDLTGIEVEFEDGSKGTISGDNAKIEITYNADGTVNGNNGALNGLVDAILSQIEGQVGSITDDIRDQVNNQLVGQVNDLIANINKQLNGINGQIKDNIDRIMADIQDKLAGKLSFADKLVDKYNALARRINNFLENPNHYLQVMMAYEDGNGNLHRASNNKMVPSRFVKGAGNAVELITTSYTAELIAPSYKKYVAVANVYNADGTLHSNSQALAEKANSAAYLNTVIPGNQQKVFINVSDLTPGLTYQIIYSSVDYRGWASSNVYYLTVAK
jgi:predicted  nucleic acid-binding Zn-ribbon protein